ncbi:MAG: hypothetical protein RIQ49_2815, partial [Pseudomonadota bacterium]
MKRHYQVSVYTRGASALLVFAGICASVPLGVMAQQAAHAEGPRLLLAAASPEAPPKGATQATNPDTVRAEMGKPLTTIQELLKAGKGQEALQRLKEVESFPNRNAYENYILERMRGAAASLAGDADTAAKAFDAVIGSGRVAAADKHKIIEAVAGNFYRVKNYIKAAEWCARYFK